jgi:3-hydroxyacyl-[acyl-carrier-protein] dehydratase
MRQLAKVLGKPESYFTDVEASSPIPPEVESEALALVWETAVDVESNAGPLPYQKAQRGGRRDRPIDRDYIADVLAPRFTKEHILLDEVIEWEEGVSATATAEMTAGTWKLGQWYKDSTFLPGLLIVEALVQTASVALLTSPKHRGRLVLCAGYDGVRLRKPVHGKLWLHAKATHVAGPVAHFDAWATRQPTTERVANGSFIIVVH